MSHSSTGSFGGGSEGGEPGAPGRPPLQPPAPTQRVSISYVVDEAFPGLGLSWGLGETKKEIILSSTECRGQAGGGWGWGSGTVFALGLAYFITAHSPAPLPSSPLS